MKPRISAAFLIGEEFASWQVAQGVPSPAASISSDGFMTSWLLWQVTQAGIPRSVNACLCALLSKNWAVAV
jgi:hypothetical protein